MTPSEFRAKHNLSPDQFKRVKRKAEDANPDTQITKQVGGAWVIPSPELLISHLPPSASPSASPSAPSASPSAPSEPPSASPSESPGAIARYSPAPLVEAELVPEVTELQIILPDHTAAIDRAQLEIANTAHISSGNRNLRRALRRKAMVEAASAEAIEDFALADKAYEATLAQLEQQQLNSLGIGATAPAPASAPASATAAKKS